MGGLKRLDGKEPSFGNAMQTLLGLVSFANFQLTVFMDVHNRDLTSGNGAFEKLVQKFGIATLNLKESRDD